MIKLGVYELRWERDWDGKVFVGVAGQKGGDLHDIIHAVWCAAFLDIFAVFGVKGCAVSAYFVGDGKL